MTTIYKLTRALSGDHELIHLSTDRSRLADLMREDIDKWTVPVSYTIEIALGFDDLLREARAGAFGQAEAALYKASNRFPFDKLDAITLRMAARIVEDLKA